MSSLQLPLRALAGIVAAAVVAGGCAQLDVPPTPQQPAPGDAVEVRGQTTDEGVECPAMRSDDGTLYTLAGAPTWVAPGQTVLVRGTIAEAAICQQGITISVTHMEVAPAPVGTRIARGPGQAATIPTGGGAERG